MVIKNKRGTVFGILLVLIILLVAGICVVFGKFFIDQFYSQVNDNIDVTPEIAQAESKMQSNMLKFDNALIVLAVVMTLGLIITSFMIPTHPIFMVINLLGIFALVFVGMIINNVYGEFVAGSGSEALTPTADQYPKIAYLMYYLPYFAAVLTFILTIVMYSRGQAQGGGGGNY